MWVGEGRERRGRWGGGAYVERLGGPEKAGWDCGASPEKEGEREGGRREGGKETRGAAGQVVSGQHCSPASRCRHGPCRPAGRLHGAL